MLLLDLLKLFQTSGSGELVENFHGVGSPLLLRD